MEYQDTNSSLFNLSLTDNVKTQLKGAALWAGIAAILSLVTTIINIVVQFMGGGASARYKSTEGFNEAVVVQAEMAGNIVSAVITLAITGLFFYFLYRFASLTKAGLNNNDQEMVNNGLGSLSAYFITIGIIFIIALAVFVFGMIAVILLLAAKR